MYSPKQVQIHENNPASAPTIRLKARESSDPSHQTLVAQKDYASNGAQDQVLDTSVGFFDASCVGKTVRLYVSEIGTDGTESAERTCVGPDGASDFHVTGPADGAESAIVIV